MATATRRRVLVIDDDELATSLLKATLEAEGFAVWTLLSPVGASQLIERSRIEAAVIDVNMPVITGDRLVRLLRSWEPFRKLPIVLVSGMSQAKLAEAARGLPDVNVVTKARAAEELPSLLRKLLAGGAAASLGQSQVMQRPVLQPSAVKATEPKTVAVAELYRKQLPDQMVQAMTLWERACMGQHSERTLLRGLLHTLKGQSQLLGYAGIAALFALVIDILSVPTDRAMPEALESAVARAFGVVSGLARGQASSMAAFDPGATLEHLSHLRDRLQGS